MANRMIFANDLPYTNGETDPIEALKDTLAFAVDDWGDSRAKAWVWGIVLGWDDEDDAMDHLADRFGWTPAQVERLRDLHERFNALSMES